MFRLRRWFATISIVAVAAAAVSAQVSEPESRVYVNDAQWLVDVLQLDEGSVVADIGAGGGELSVLLADHVGPEGRVYASELGDENVEELREEVEEASVSNVTVIEGAPTATNLPEECCDALVMRRVYHHIDDPAAMNESLLQSLKPGGRLAVIDFQPRGSESEDPGGRDEGSQHGVTLDTVTEELKRAGFTIISGEQRSGRDIYVAAEKPDE